jgi:hypothetical protein
MPESFDVAEPADGAAELDDKTRHAVVAAQLRGEAKAEGQGPEAVMAAVAEELEELGLKPDEGELHRRYEESEVEVPELDEEPGGSIDNPR